MASLLDPVLPLGSLQELAILMEGVFYALILFSYVYLFLNLFLLRNYVYINIYVPQLGNWLITQRIFQQNFTWIPKDIFLPKNQLSAVLWYRYKTLACWGRDQRQAGCAESGYPWEMTWNSQGFTEDMWRLAVGFYKNMLVEVEDY